MESTIDKFYDYECNFINWLNRGEKYAELKKEIGERISKLEESLTEEQKRILKEMALLYYQKEGEAERAAYAAGFKMGMKLAVESLSSQEEG